MEGRYSTRSPAVKRLMREAQELCEPTDQYFAQPLEDNLFEWHFTIRGPLDSDFQAGVYHGRIILPVDYPMKPPSIIWLTPNGRFETNKKICLSISGHHPESWQPSWSIRTALLAIIGFMPTHPGGAIGSLDYKPDERKTLAKKSRDWKCPVCGDVSEILLEPNPESSQTSQEAKELATQISFQGEKPKSADNKVTSEAAMTNSTSQPLPSTEGISNNASTQLPPSAPTNEPPSPAASIHNPGGFLPPWSCSPGAPNSNSILPPFMYYPWASHAAGYGEQVSCLAAQIPRFPYPPSQYAIRGNSSFYPPGFTLPHGIGMFPCSIPPPPLATAACNPPSHSANIRISVNNSSVSPPNGSLSHSPGVSAAPDIPRLSPAGSNLVCFPGCSPHKDDKSQLRLNTQAEVPNGDAAEGTAVIHTRAENSPATSAADDSSELRKPGAVIGESDNAQAGLGLVSLLTGEALSSQNVSYTKTKDVLALERDVDGDQDYSTGFQPNSSQAMDIEAVSQALMKAFDSVDSKAERNCDVVGAVDLPPVTSSVQVIGDHCQIEENTDKSQLTDAASKSFSSQIKDSLNESTGMEISHSELLADAEGDDDSRLLAAQLSDMEQRSHFERSTSSSMPELKMNLKQATPKGLRQRQSATAYVPTDAAGVEENLPEQVNSRGLRQRIEAVSGDSSQANQRFIQNDMHNVNDVGNPHRRQRRPNSAYDTSFFIMIGLCLSTVFIILNRLFHMVDLSDLLD